MGMYRDFNDYEVMYLVEEQNEDAREILFQKYKPIILKLAYQYQNEARLYGLEVDDIIQEAYLGLYQAIQTYDSNNNVLFYTYAMISIRSKILNCLTMKKADKHKHLNQGISLFHPLSMVEDGSLIDILEDKKALLPHLMVEEKELKVVIHNFLLTLDFLSACVFELKMNGFQNQDIMKLLDVSLKSVSNILFRVRKKLKDYLKLEKLL